MPAAQHSVAAGRTKEKWRAQHCSLYMILGSLWEMPDATHNHGTAPWWAWCAASELLYSKLIWAGISCLDQRQTISPQVQWWWGWPDHPPGCNALNMISRPCLKRLLYCIQHFLLWISLLASCIRRTHFLYLKHFLMI